MGAFLLLGAGYFILTSLNLFLRLFPLFLTNFDLIKYTWNEIYI